MAMNRAFGTSMTRQAVRQRRTVGKGALRTEIADAERIPDAQFRQFDLEAVGGDAVYVDRSFDDQADAGARPSHVIEQASLAKRLGPNSRFVETGSRE